MAERATAVLSGPPATGTGRGGGGERAAGGGGNRAADGRPGRNRGSRRPTRSSVRFPELVLGVMLVAGGALASVLWATSEPTQRVLVAARPIARGDMLDVSMMRWAEIRGDALVSIADPAALAGRIAVVDMAPGAPLLDSALRPPTTVGLDQVEVGLALAPGEYPVGLAVGDTVVVVVLQGRDEYGVVAEPVSLATPAEVLAAPLEGDPAREVVVNLLVGRSDIEVIAAAEGIRLARLGPET